MNQNKIYLKHNQLNMTRKFKEYKINQKQLKDKKINIHQTINIMYLNKTINKYSKMIHNQKKTTGQQMNVAYKNQNQRKQEKYNLNKTYNINNNQMKHTIKTKLN